MVKVLNNFVAYQGRAFCVTESREDALKTKRSISNILSAPTTFYYTQKSATSIEGIAWRILNYLFSVDQMITKNSGIALAKKVKQFLLRNPFSLATLIANGSGSEIVREALRSLSKEHQRRINVITLESKVPIPNALGKTVLNFVPYTTPLTPPQNSWQFKIPPNPGIDYLSSLTVRFALQQLTVPALYSVQQIPQSDTKKHMTLYS